MLQRLQDIHIHLQAVSDCTTHQQQQHLTLSSLTTQWIMQRLVHFIQQINPLAPMQHNSACMSTPTGRVKYNTRIHTFFTLSSPYSPRFVEWLCFPPCQPWSWRDVPPAALRYTAHVFSGFTVWQQLHQLYKVFSNINHRYLCRS
jgi:hypothetical protein